MYSVLCKNILLTDLLGIQHLFEILQTSPTFKNNENMEKKLSFRKTFAMETANFFRNKGGI